MLRSGHYGLARPSMSFFRCPHGRTHGDTSYPLIPKVLDRRGISPFAQCERSSARLSRYQAGACGHRGGSQREAQSDGQLTLGGLDRGVDPYLDRGVAPRGRLLGECATFVVLETHTHLLTT